MKKTFSLFLLSALLLSFPIVAFAGSAYGSYGPNSTYNTDGSENQVNNIDSRPLAVDDKGLCITAEEFSKLLGGLVTGEYKDYQEFVFPVKITQESKDQESKKATFYLDCDNGTTFQMICGLMDKDGSVTPAKTTDIAQNISLWGLINEDSDMLYFQLAAGNMIFLTQPEDDTFSTTAGIMLDLTGNSFGEFTKYGSVEYKFDYYPEAYNGDDAVFFTVRNVLNQ